MGTWNGLIAGVALAMTLSACAAPVAEEPETDPLAVPEQVAALAAPNQDLQTARLLPEDGCYWYTHAGPVETTLLPLVTVDDRPICTSQQP